MLKEKKFLEGFNGKSEKLIDVSYFWCVLSNIFMIEREDFFNKDLLIKLIFEYQDDEWRGIDDPYIMLYEKQKVEETK